MRTAPIRRFREGMTIIEIMIVILITGLMLGAMTMGVGALTKQNLRAACVKLIAASRFAYSRAVSQHTTVRVVLDMDQKKISIDEAHGHVALARSDDERRGEGMSEEDNAGVDPWAAARERLSKTFKPNFGASPFSPIVDDEGEPIERYQPKPFEGGVRIARMFLPHEPQPRERGRGAIYFFPGGYTEHAVVQFSDTDPGEENARIYTVEIHPLTGRGKVHPEAFEPEPISEDADEESQSDVEEEF